MWSELFDGMSRVATTRYERRVGIGSLVLADARSEHVERVVSLREPVPVSETRTLRKLLETSSRHGESLLTDGTVVYGLGRLRADYSGTSESVVQLLVVGDGTWELLHAGVPLATVQFEAPRLPETRLQRERLDDIAGRVFREWDSDALWALATAAADAEHGTMLVVVSERADEEAARLRSQALTVEPTTLDERLVRQVTGIDGAVLVHSNGHLAGVRGRHDQPTPRPQAKDAPLRPGSHDRRPAGGRSHPTGPRRTVLQGIPAGRGGGVLSLIRSD